MSDTFKNTTIDPSEVEKFTAMAEQWWDPDGKFKPLHRLNPVRIEYIRDHVKKHFDIRKVAQPFDGLSVLDIGCGGGLLSEPMARLGAKTTAIDASDKNIQIASLHAQKMQLDIDYRVATAEALVAQEQQFDVVLNMEVVEHVADVKQFMKASCDLVKPGGMLFVATLNRTVKSYMLAVLGAEYILRWLPRGTHDWRKFLKPSEITAYTHANGVMLQDVSGVVFNPLTNQWKISQNLEVNYLMMFKKSLHV